jgi:transposase
VFTAVFSRHTFVYLTFRQTLEAVIEGFERAWCFFGGVFAVVIPDNMKAIVDRASPTNPRLNQAFLEYAQDRGFVVDAARVGRAKDKARVERTVAYVRESLFRGESLRDLDDAQAWAEAWCTERAGARIHGTTHRRPLEVFLSEERPLLRPAPEAPTTSRSTPSPRSTPTTTSRWPRPCTRCRGPSSGSACSLSL